MARPRTDSDAAQAALRALHDEVDARASALARRHVGRLRCGRGCSACCQDGLTVFEVEAERIRRAHADLLDQGAPHAPGACAFLDAEGGCRIYPDRPYVCRTQGLPLRWIGEDEDGRIGEQRDICPLNEAGPPASGARSEAKLSEVPLELLPEDACWTIGPTEGRLAAIESAYDGGALRRVALRSLFRRSTHSG
ncbi:MAG TPA: YkgJ family cysteine cluster protein [Myxococcota bacterium]|nr:YkgJ family cysteine cluster protein [Myxococcota bacterium]